MRYYGEIGYSVSVETSPGVWTQEITTRNYYGDVIRNTQRWDKGVSINDDRTINNSISIIADPFAYQNFHAIKYVKWMGTKWKVNSIEVQRPRIILGIGGVWNEE